MKKYIIIALLFIMAHLAKAQEQVSLAFLQDVKLATIGDKDHGYDAFTLNVIARVKMQGNQQKHGFLIVYPEVEYADLKQSYLRYSANAGYTFNQLFINNFEASLFGGFGFINRDGEGSSSLSLTGELGYRLSNRFKIVMDGQMVQRSDIQKNIFSGFLGVEFKIFNYE